MSALLALIGICFLLSLDNFQSSIGLGSTNPKWGRLIQGAFVFAACDAIAPVLGLWIGSQVGDRIGETAEMAAAGLLACYAVFLIVRGIRQDQDEDFDHPMAILGLPIPLSVDNLLAGASLGVSGAYVYSMAEVAIVAGAMTLAMSLVGLAIGKFIASKVSLRTDLFAGLVILLLSGLMVARG